MASPWPSQLVHISCILVTSCLGVGPNASLRLLWCLVEHLVCIRFSAGMCKGHRKQPTFYKNYFQKEVAGQIE